MKNRVYVWDLLVRFFHWTLVVAFVLAYLSGEEESLLHVYAGYYILGLIAIRLVWGFVGTPYARFSQFLTAPGAVIKYLKELFVRDHSDERPENFVGHNPAAGWMVIAILLSLLATNYTGLKVYGLEGDGPFAINSVRTSQQQTPDSRTKTSESDEAYHDDEEYDDGDEEEEEFWEEIHEFLANFTVLLIVLHISGVLLSSRKHQQNLAKSMLTGYKSNELMLGIPFVLIAGISSV